MEIKGVNHEELFKQMKEQAIQSNEYILFETFIGADMENPFARLTMGEANQYQMIAIMCALIATLKDLAEEFPELYEEALKAKIASNIYSEICKMDKEDVEDME